MHMNNKKRWVISMPEGTDLMRLNGPAFEHTGWITCQDYLMSNFL